MASWGGRTAHIARQSPARAACLSPAPCFSLSALRVPELCLEASSPQGATTRARPRRIATWLTPALSPFIRQAPTAHPPPPRRLQASQSWLPRRRRRRQARAPPAGSLTSARPTASTWAALTTRGVLSTRRPASTATSGATLGRRDARGTLPPSRPTMLSSRGRTARRRRPTTSRPRSTTTQCGLRALLAASPQGQCHTTSTPRTKRTLLGSHRTRRTTRRRSRLASGSRAPHARQSRQRRSTPPALATPCTTRCLLPWTRSTARRRRRVKKDRPSPASATRTRASTHGCRRAGAARWPWSRRRSR